MKKPSPLIGSAKVFSVALCFGLPAVAAFAGTLLSGSYIMGQYHHGDSGDWTSRRLLVCNTNGNYTNTTLADSRGSQSTESSSLSFNPDGSFTVVSSGDTRGQAAPNGALFAGVSAPDSGGSLELSFGVKKASGMSKASFVGNYVMVDFGTDPQPWVSRAVISPDGKGGLPYTEKSDSNGSLGSGTYHYTVATDGTLKITDKPTESGFLSADGSLFCDIDTNANRSLSLKVGVRKSSGMSNASLNGRYMAMSYGFNDPNDASSAYTRRQLVTCDAAGHAQWTDLDYSDGALSSGSSTYTVAADGVLSSSGGFGQVSADGSMYIWAIANTNGDYIAVEIGIRTVPVLAPIVMDDFSGGSATITNGQMLALGKTYTVTATAKPGFQFQSWNIYGTTNHSSPNKATMTFQMTNGLSMEPFFRDIQPPKLVLNPPPATVSDNVLTLSGTAWDNGYLYPEMFTISINGTMRVISLNGTNWQYIVILSPGNNIIKISASDAGGNFTTITNKIADSFSGLAPASLNGLSISLFGTNNSTYGFGRGVYYKYSYNSQAEFGAYTYTRTGPNAATITLVNDSVFGDTGTTSFVLTFTKSYSGTLLINGDPTANDFDLDGIPNVVPSDLLGRRMVSESYSTMSAYITNDFAWNVLTQNDSLNNHSAGVYTYAALTPSDAMIMCMLTNAGTITTNVVLVHFYVNEMPMGGASLSGSYSLQSASATGTAFDTGYLSLYNQSTPPAGLAPHSLAGTRAAITITKNTLSRSFVLTFGPPTCAYTSGTTNGSIDGIGYYTYVATGKNTASLVTQNFLPPNGMNTQPETHLLTFTPTGIKVQNDDGSSGTATTTAAPNLVPLSIVNRKITLTFTGAAASDNGTGTFKYGTFTTTGKTAGTYTFAQYTPRVAMVTMTATDGDDEGKVFYAQLTFSDATHGYVYFTKIKNGVSQTEEAGTFTMQ